MICDRCNWLIGDGCPCRANTTTEFEVQRRHREAVTRAKAAGWAGHARRPQVDPRGIRRWAA